ncbi:uncharacterized protein LOC133315447 [Gastrolobium bilobum]|uniref:uncharacterized protein LOC133315447 n=1 Tax=Gastrolobium bilobum TaxID=150636 RepID=UPI002AB1E98D|nr:uncharacterized protein LOC133315447 [Gastrolobium bilobum]
MRKYHRGQYNDIPFVDEIVDAPFSKNLNLSELLKYDGTQDPQAHLDSFDTAIFKIAALQVLGLSEKVHLHLIIAGLHGSSRLAKSIYKDPSRTLVEFTARSKKYLELEQMEIENMDQKHDPNQIEKPESRRQNDFRGKTQDDKIPARGRFETNAPLNSPRSEIWREVASMEMKKVDRPHPLLNQVGLDQSWYCAFHDGPGHTTDECWDLRDAIEKYIRDEKLRQYLIRTQGWKNNRKRRGDRPMSPSKEKRFKEEGRGKKLDKEEDEFVESEFEWNVINEAFGGGGDTMNARRKYLRELFSIRERPKFKEAEPEPPLLYFTRKDLEDVMPGHVDGLVITGTLVNCRVKKIFVDNGSCGRSKK